MDHLAAVARKSEAGASYLFSIILVFLVLSGLVSWSVDEDILVGFWLRLWFGLEEVVSRLTSLDLSRFIRWWEGIPLDETTTRSLASAQHYHPSFPFFRHIYIILSLPTMVLIATCIYFAWSPVLARASPLFGLCCLICGWISHFTHALISRVSYGAHREGLIKTIYGGKPALAPHIIPLPDDSAGSLDDEQHIFIGLKEIHDNEDKNTRAATRRDRRTAPFSIPRPWDREAPRLVKEHIDEIVEFLENVDDIIELGRVVDEQTRKALLTSYLPPSIRKLWRELRTYDVEHSYANFRFEILHLYPEVDERRRGSFAGLVQLCQEFKGVERDEEGHLCRFGVMFCGSVKRLQAPVALITNRDACVMYLRTLDSGFARRVQQFVEERSVATVLLRQFGAGVDEDKVQIQRKEDVIDLRDLVQLTEAISRTNVTYLVGEITASSDEEIRARDVETLAPIETLKKSGQREIGWRDLRRPMMRDSLDVFAQEAGSMIQSLEEERRKEYEIDQLRTEVQRLMEKIHALDSARRDSLNETFTWCRDEIGVLWDTIKVVKKGLDERELDSTHKQPRGSQHGVGQCELEMDLLREEIFSGFNVLRDEVRTIQVRLHNVQFEQKEIVKVENGLTRVFDEVGFIGESLSNLQEGFERQRIDLDALHKEMMNESDLVRDEIRTIQTRLHQARMWETVPIPFDTSEVFLMNRMKEETRLEIKENHVPQRDKRAFEPLLSKKQKRALERAGLARTRTRKSRKNVEREAEVENVDEVAAEKNSEENYAERFEFPNNNNSFQEWTSCRNNESEYSEDDEHAEISELARGDRQVEYENFENRPKSRKDVLDARETLGLRTQL